MYISVSKPKTNFKYSFLVGLNHFLIGIHEPIVLWVLLKMVVKSKETVCAAVFSQFTATMKCTVISIIYRL